MGEYHQHPYHPNHLNDDDDRLRLPPIPSKQNNMLVLQPEQRGLSIAPMPLRHRHQSLISKHKDFVPDHHNIRCIYNNKIVVEEGDEKQEETSDPDFNLNSSYDVWEHRDYSVDHVDNNDNNLNTTSNQHNTGSTSNVDHENNDAEPEIRSDHAVVDTSLPSLLSVSLSSRHSSSRLNNNIALPKIRNNNLVSATRKIACHCDNSTSSFKPHDVDNAATTTALTATADVNVKEEKEKDDEKKKDMSAFVPLYMMENFHELGSCSCDMDHCEDYYGTYDVVDVTHQQQEQEPASKDNDTTNIVDDKRTGQTEAVGAVETEKDKIMQQSKIIKDEDKDKVKVKEEADQKILDTNNIVTSLKIPYEGLTQQKVKEKEDTTTSTKENNNEQKVNIKEFLDDNSSVSSDQDDEPYHCFRVSDQSQSEVPMIRVLRRPAPFRTYHHPKKYVQIPKKHQLPKNVKNPCAMPWGFHERQFKAMEAPVKYPIPIFEYPYIKMFQSHFKHYDDCDTHFNEINQF